jgi:serine/threonine protein kinase
MIETNHAQLDENRGYFLAQAADAIGYVHTQKYLHRDICPRNLMITPKGRLKLIDFGLSLPYQPDFCKPGNRTGTVQYLAPEIVKRLATDHRVDLFALGVTAYELYTRELPWGRTDSIDRMFSSMNRSPADPREYKKDLDEATARFLLKAVDREPAKRFQTAGEFKDAINKLATKW